MEKLVELLNEYTYGENKELYYRDNEMVHLNSDRVISKQFGFIRWLVENDKIDHGKLSNYIIDNKFFGDKIAELKEYETLLMLLSISDTPIEDLLLYLK